MSGGEDVLNTVRNFLKLANHIFPIESNFLVQFLHRNQFVVPPEAQVHLLKGLGRGLSRRKRNRFLNSFPISQLVLLILVINEDN